MKKIILSFLLLVSIVSTKAQSLGPLISTHWTQSDPYNSLCPNDPLIGGRSYAGCTAVAMAQILNYNRTTLGRRFGEADRYSHVYCGRNYLIDQHHDSIGFPSFEVLNGMLDWADSIYAIGEELGTKEVAALIFASGVLCRQVFTANNSGTFNVAQAYEGYLRCGFAHAKIYESCDQEMYDRLNANLGAGYPAHVALEDATGAMGHNLVIDGYDGEGRYHFNFGYGGAYDGWYSLPDETMPLGMTALEGIILDIIPPDDYLDCPEPMLAPQVTLYPNPSVGDTRLSLKGLCLEGRVVVEVFDMAGRRLISKKLYLSGLNAPMVLPTAQLAAGSYVVRVQTPFALYRQRLVLIR